MMFDRRGLIRGSAGLTFAAALSASPLFARSLGANPFTLGVASGDPWPDGFVLWTRLAIRPLDEHGGMPMAMVPVSWEVAEDDQFRRIVRTGNEFARPELGHSVHVELGGLQPARRYWYRFHAAGEVSPAGTVRTAPAAHQMANQLRIGLAGCQHYEWGHFTAFKHLSQEPDLDAVFHFGDYIYEYTGDPDDKSNLKIANRVRLHAGQEIFTLDDYRRRHAQYKTDPDLQAAHAAAPFLMSYDDHEIDNDWAGDIDEKGTPPEYFRFRRAASFQAWYENAPVRRAQMPTGASMPLFRRMDFGRLLRLHVLDTRQYRDDQLCSAIQRPDFPCKTESTGPSTILGQAQENWLGDGLSKDAQWNLLAQQVMMMPFWYPGPGGSNIINVDAWSGYADARDRLVAQIQERGLKNVVIASGDVHKHHVGVIPARAEALDGPAVATEFVGTSISSGGDGREFPNGWENVPGHNPQLKFTSDRRGYQLFDITPKRWLSHLRTVDYVSQPDSPVRTKASYVVEAGRAGEVYPA